MPDANSNSNSDQGGNENNGGEKKTPVFVHKYYRYHIETFQILCDDLPEPVTMAPGCIREMHIEKDFDNYFYPIFTISCVINPKLKQYLIFNKDKVKFRIRLQGDEIDTNGQILASIDEFNALFIPLISDSLPFMDEELYDQTAEELKRAAGQRSDLSLNNLEPDSTEMAQYYLYVEKDLNNSKNVINAVYQGANLRDITVKALSDNGFDAILMSPPDNGGAVSQVIIPPMNMLKLFDWLNDQYGLYSSGIIRFFDTRCVYVLNKSGHPNACDKGEYPTTIISIHPTKAAEAKVPGTYVCDERKEYHIYADPYQVHIESDSVFADQIYGNNLTRINSSKNSSSTIGGTGEQTGSGNTRVDYNTDDNDYNKVQYASSVSENNCKVLIRFSDVMMFALTPNKEFLIDWVDSKLYGKYSGYYRPTKMDYIFSRNGDGFNLDVNGYFVKKTDISAAVKASVDNVVSPKVDVKNTLGGGKKKGLGI